MPKPQPPTEWIALRSLAEKWSVNRVWLSGLVGGMGITTSRGRHNETLVKLGHVAAIQERVKLLTVVNSG